MTSTSEFPIGRCPKSKQGDGGHCLHWREGDGDCCHCGQSVDLNDDGSCMHTVTDEDWICERCGADTRPDLEENAP